MVSVGVDIVEVKRVEDAIGRWGDKFLARIFTPAEIAYCRGRASEAASFAVRWAAKEAFAKALKVGKVSIWKEVEVTRGEGPRPAVAVHGGARTMVGARRIDLSLSHADSHAIAVVLIED